MHVILHIRIPVLPWRQSRLATRSYLCLRSQSFAEVHFLRICMTTNSGCFSVQSQTFNPVLSLRSLQRLHEILLESCKAYQHPHSSYPLFLITITTKVKQRRPGTDVSRGHMGVYRDNGKEDGSYHLGFRFQGLEESGFRGLGSWLRGYWGKMVYVTERVLSFLGFEDPSTGFLRPRAQKDSYRGTSFCEIAV